MNTKGKARMLNAESMNQAKGMRCNKKSTVKSGGGGNVSGKNAPYRKCKTTGPRKIGL
jgi:hypothetical protein